MSVRHEDEAARSAAWYKDAIIDQFYVRGVCSAAGERIGDFLGLARKLDDLYSFEPGSTAVWRLPFSPVPLKHNRADRRPLLRDVTKSFHRLCPGTSKLKARWRGKPRRSAGRGTRTSSCSAAACRVADLPSADAATLAKRFAMPGAADQDKGVRTKDDA